MDSIQVKNLTKQFGKFKAVDNISFEVTEGEILGLLGPNGAGKTTTIQMLLGVLTPTSGDVKFFGKSFAKHREEILEKVNFSSTYTNLPWNLSVKENLTYISYLYDLPDRKKQLQTLIDIFRLEKLLNHPLSELSAGQLTRVNLAKAFINNPQVLLLDEPTASLDPEVAKLVRDFIIGERKKRNLSIIFTSHNMGEVEEVCDRILFINNGVIVANDTPENLMKSMDQVKVRVVVDEKNTEIIRLFSNQLKRAVKINERECIIELKENEVSNFLSFLNEKAITYHEISIDKPDLEDYFLQVARDNKNRDL